MNENSYNNLSSSDSVKPTYKERLMKALKKFMMTVCFAYLIIVLALVLLENQMIYPAPKFPAGYWKPGFAHKDVEFRSADGVKIHSWVMEAKEERETPRYILYCHGNGENVSHASSWAGTEIVNQLGGNVMVFDYRGYGKSEGSPGEEGIKLDADRAMEVFCDEFGIKPTDVILMGQSLGGGVATHLAATKGCKALVLQRTFSSLPDVAASKYPWIPVRFLMQNNFNSAEAIENYKGPVFQSHGEADTIIPIRFGEKLHSKTSHELNKFVRLPKIGHNDGFPFGYWKRVDKWLNEVEAASKEANSEPESSGSTE